MNPRAEIMGLLFMHGIRELQPGTSNFFRRYRVEKDTPACAALIEHLNSLSWLKSAASRLEVGVVNWRVKAKYCLAVQAQRSKAGESGGHDWRLLASLKKDSHLVVWPHDFPTEVPNEPEG